MKFRKKPVTVEATQWFKNGDHPLDASELFTALDGESFLSEGHVVRYFRRPDVSGETPCRHCAQRMHVHGWIDTKEGGHIVCPGDWIITGVAGEVYPCKPDIFERTYDREENFPTELTIEVGPGQRITAYGLQENLDMHRRFIELCRYWEPSFPKIVQNMTGRMGI